eukprot:56164-Chlamydomonas_euryale.AAC.6
MSCGETGRDPPGWNKPCSVPSSSMTTVTRLPARPSSSAVGSTSKCSLYSAHVSASGVKPSNRRRPATTVAPGARSWSGACRRALPSSDTVVAGSAVACSAATAASSTASSTQPSTFSTYTCSDADHTALPSAMHNCRSEKQPLQGALPALGTDSADALRPNSTCSRCSATVATSSGARPGRQSALLNGATSTVTFTRPMVGWLSSGCTIDNWTPAKTCGRGGR